MDSAPDAPLFSVVIATYNYGHLIAEAVDSVLGQTCRDFELIVVDDGSTDDTPSVISRYGDQVRYVRKENGGQSSAYNLGADLACGRYVYILDADDILLPDTLKHFAAAIARHEPQSNAGTRLYFGGYVSVSIDGRKRVRAGAEAPAQTGQRLKTFLRGSLTGMQNGAVIVPRKLFSRIRFPEQLRNNTDIVFLGQAIALMPAVQIHEPVFCSREHPLRTRKQIEKIMDAGLAPVAAMFDPRVMPAELMPLERVYRGQRLRSIARLLFLEGRRREARDSYLAALRTDPACMLQLSSLGKLMACLFRPDGAVPR